MNSNPNWTLAQWRGPAAPDTWDREKNHVVALLAKQEDFDCLMLASLGIGANAIASYTGLTRAQVYYRLEKGGVKIRDYREGRGPFAGMVFQGLARRAAKQLTIQVRTLENGRADTNHRD